MLTFLTLRHRLLMVLSLTGSSAALAAPGARAPLDVRARYEEGLIQAALQRHGLRLEPRPEGKRIERVIVDASNVILPGDLPLASRIPWTWANAVHVRTRDYIIAQELLFQRGQPYRTDLVEESGRILRSLFILSVARLVAAAGSAPDTVVVLVVTKDQWSLRANSNFGVDQGRLDTLSFSFSENNVAGRNKTISINFAMDPGRLAVGLRYVDPRIWSSRHFLSTQALLYLNRHDSTPEGALFQLSVGRPLYSLRTRWAWNLSFDFVQEKVRFFRGGDIRLLSGDDAQFLRPLTSGLAGLAGLPAVYGSRRINGQLEGTRSFGVVRKLNLSAGFRVASTRNQTTEEFPQDAPEAARRYFQQQFLPRSEDAAGPYLALSAYQASYVRLQNVDTLALSEDFRLGPSVALELRYASPIFGLPSHFVELSGSYTHRFFFHDNLLSYNVALAARVQAGVRPLADGVDPDAALVNEDVSATLRNISPKLGPLRLHVYGRLRLRARDLNNVQLSLGSDSGLRGFAPRFFQGGSRYAVNVELRSVALNLWTLHVGGALFYDGGDAPLSLQQGAWHQNLGVGLRVLIPQFNRDVIRLDLAFPLEGAVGAYVPRFSAEFGQAF